MRIGLLTTFFSPDVHSGIARYIEDLALGLANSGHDVEVIAVGIKPYPPERRDGFKINWIFHPKIRWLYWLPFLRLLWGSFKIRKKLIEIHSIKPFDIVEYPNTEVAGLLSVFFRFPAPRPQFVIRLSSPRSIFLKKYQFIRLTELLEKYQACLSDAIIGNTQSNFSLCEQIYGFSDALPHCVILHGLPYGVKPFMATPLSEADKILRVFFLGRMEHRKGFDILAKAWPKVAASIPHVQLIVAGEDLPYQDEPSYFSWSIKKMPIDVRKRIDYRGVIDSVERELLYQQCDICVIPSRYESFGLTALEAMRYGKPVISCCVGGIPEVVRHGITGILVPPEDHETLAEALIKMLQDIDFREQLGRNALVDVDNRFSIERVVMETANFYMSLVN